jgi:CspA family cold shock protein
VVAISGAGIASTLSNKESMKRGARARPSERIRFTPIAEIRSAIPHFRVGPIATASQVSFNHFVDPGESDLVHTAAAVGILARWLYLLTSTSEFEMAKGTVKWFNPTKGYGFIQPAGGGGKDVFVHISAVEKAGLSTLNEGQTVEYEEVPNKGKTSAENLKVV